MTEQVFGADLRCFELLNAIYCEPKVGVEVGVARGALSWRLLASNRALFLYLVDPWAEVATDSAYRTTDDTHACQSQAEHEANRAATMEKIAPFAGQYEVLRMTSADAATQFDHDSLDFVFIDADHSYEGCRSDIDLWIPKLKDGAVLSGHDYRNERNYGVQRAVDEFSHATGRAVRLGANYTWFMRK